MDAAAGEIQMASSLRRDSGSMWRRGDNVFSRSPSRGAEVDDEEALRWAALEKLPTRDRVRHAIFRPPDDAQGAVDVVDVRSLGHHERHTLLERLLRVADEDHERFLLKLKGRLERVGIEMPTIEVRFKHLEVEAKVRVGRSGLPTLLNAVTNTLEEVGSALHLVRSRKQPMPILHDVSGIIKPRRLTLLLGPPGSGKTTLLLALAGRLDKDLKVSGRVTYNGHGMDEFVPERASAYISQHDLHIGEMTVRETLAFSARCQGVGSRFDMLTELLRREKAENIKPDGDIDAFMKASAARGQEYNVVTDYILKILGLETCADTLVGDELIRGISGGQRKRVTTGEMLVGPARALFMDEISTGLDSSTTFQIVDCLRQSIHVLGGTAVISLLQPAPETFNLFDDIILLSDGLVVYQGPREDVLEFFETMGFRCPERKGVADFLQEVTSRKDQKQYWTQPEESYRFVPAMEFANALKLFHTGRDIANELSVPFDKSMSHPAALTTTRYGVSGKELLKANIDREILLIKRNAFVYMFRTSQLIVLSAITMTLFIRTNMHRDSVADGGIYMGALFFGVLVMMVNGYSELALTVIKLPVFFKQRDLLFYPAWAYSIPSWIVKAPLTLIEAGGYVFLTYYVTGFDPNVGRFFKQYLIMIVINQMAASLFRFMGGVARNMIIANVFSTLLLLLIMVLGGFILAKDNVKKWWIWGYWISPMMYAQNAISVNEMLGHSWDKILNTTTKETLGVEVLKSRGMFPEAKWYWIGFGALIGFTILFNALFTLALTYLSRSGNPQQVISEEELKQKQDNARRNVLGMVLPFPPLSLTFENIKYSVDMPKEMKAHGVMDDRLQLLKDVSGSFRPGVLTALMGVSGAGKTTLMDVLAGRKIGGYIEGNISISGYPKKQDTFSRVSGYCEQNDIHSPQVTIYESLIFSAWLRLPMDIDSNKRNIFIEEVMELMELKPLQDALVGLPGVNGLSTEQRKRLTIAVELVANPSIIFMDEPTSGLDARAAAIVMRTVRNTVDTGRTVVCTIHQPSIDIFEAFDEVSKIYMLFLLKRGGEEIYAGPIGHHSSELIKYFEGIQGIRKIKDGYNPATWMLEVTTVSQEQMLGVDFSDIYKNSELYQEQPQDLFNAMGSMYAAVIFIGISNCNTVLPVVSVERTVFYRERAAGLYSAFPYAIGQVAIELPYALVQTIAYGVIVYAMIGFKWTAAKFFWYIFFMYFSLLYFTFYGMMAVGMTPNYNIAMIVAAVFYAIWNLFSGFVIPLPKVPIWWRWYYWICPVAWTLYGLVVSQYGDIMTPMDDGTPVKVFVEDYFDFKHSWLGWVAAVVVAFSMLFAALFGFAIMKFNFQKR
ncbi:hypothetical protein EJB05_44558 [Eragrostis curvula]|uniref:ABC transporter domain-containing protein n=1 Tax=Eragrostis curvula TaxID=38414 RepID=A0A5J9THZ7_9POAL|nr:hypothetical protein EJB05_44558 [Eragrostis curvula]